MKKISFSIVALLSILTYNASAQCTTTHQIVKATSASTVGCSQITDDNTNVGVGTTTPATKLHVQGGSLWLANGSGASMAGSPGAGLRLYYNTSSNQGVIFPYDYTNNVARDLIIQHTDGRIGIGPNATTPTAKLHVDVSGLTNTTGIRFQGLPQTTNPYILVIDSPALGNVSYRTLSSLNILSNSCNTANYLLRATGTNTTACSVIQDNGSNVGVSMSAGGSWTGGGADISGSPTNPTVVKLDVNGMVRCSTLVVISDKNAKTNIKPISSAIEKVKSLNGVSYNWIDTKQPERSYDNSTQLGFLAQDVEKVIPEAVGHDGNGGYGMNYIAIIPVLTEAIKEQQVSIEVMKQENAELKKLLQDVCTYGCDKMSLNTSIADFTKGKGAYLNQNAPNPSKGETTFNFFVPKDWNAADAKIVITDLTGKTVASLPATASGEVSIKYSTTSLAQGIYNYTLIVGNNIVDTKKMIIE